MIGAGDPGWPRLNLCAIHEMSDSKSRQLTVEDARESMLAHVASKGTEIRERYGAVFGWKELLALLQDRNFVRYPCEIVFDSKPLLEGEFAVPVAKGERPDEGYTLYVHPYFMTQLEKVPALALYQLVLVNYGEFASPDDAETFGAAVLGMSKDEYYQMICDLADELNGEAADTRRL